MQLGVCAVQWLVGCGEVLFVPIGRLGVESDEVMDDSQVAFVPLDAGAQLSPDAGEHVESTSSYASDAACPPGSSRHCECRDAGDVSTSCVPGDGVSCRVCPAKNPNLIRCASGAYDGVLAGTYFGDLPGATASLELPLGVRGQFVLDRLSFGEFYSVGNGCIRLFRPDGSVDDSARISIQGEVDCSSGELNGVLRGFYTRTEWLLPWRVYFMGQVKGTYDPLTRSFQGTSWTAFEQPSSDGTSAHASGTWGAKLNEEGPRDSGVDAGPCLDEAFPDHLFE